MAGRTALVTGGTGAIGREISQALADAGFRVAANCYPTDVGSAEEWLKSLNGSGDSIRIISFDTADY